MDDDTIEISILPFEESTSLSVTWFTSGLAISSPTEDSLHPALFEHRDFVARVINRPRLYCRMA